MVILAEVGLQISGNICQFEAVELRKNQRVQVVLAMIEEATRGENLRTAEERFTQKCKLWKALGNKVSAGRFLPALSMEERTKASLWELRPQSNPGRAKHGCRGWHWTRNAGG